MSLADLFKPIYGIAIKRQSSPHEIVHRKTFDSREDAVKYIRKVKNYGTYESLRVIKMGV